jgi:hypothetical protein
MPDELGVPERGVLTVPAKEWDRAARRATVTRERAGQPAIGLDAADDAAAELGVSRRHVYTLVRRWREGEGLVSDLLPGTSSGGRGEGRLADEVEAIVAEVLRKRYLTRQRQSRTSCTPTTRPSSRARPCTAAASSTGSGCATGRPADRYGGIVERVIGTMMQTTYETDCQSEKATIEHCRT